MTKDQEAMKKGSCPPTLEDAMTLLGRTSAKLYTIGILLLDASTQDQGQRCFAGDKEDLYGMAVIMDEAALSLRDMKAKIAGMWEEPEDERGEP